MLIEKGSQHLLHWHKWLMIGWKKWILRRLWELYCFDFSVAFDIIDHNLLSKKLLCYGFSTSAISWIRSYLSYRTQSVFFNGSFSNVKHVKCGVPQGSSLGPLFSIFTNDLPLALNKACASRYADDSTIYASATTANEVTETLNFFGIGGSIFTFGWIACPE